MVKLSELTPADEVRQHDLRDPEYRAEYERTRFANEVAIEVIRYRSEHGLTQTALARKLGMRQPHIARIESGHHQPSVTTLARLAAALGENFTLAITPAGISFRRSA